MDYQTVQSLFPTITKDYYERLESQLPAHRASVVCNTRSNLGEPLTTVLVRHHRFVLAELNTHRALSRNGASSRAIPTARLLEEVRTDPAIPFEWGIAGKGMQSHGLLSESDATLAKEEWLKARDNAVASCEKMEKLGVAKQLANRPLEAFMWQDTLITSNRWRNFFTLRIHKDAQPEMCSLAYAIWRAIESSEVVESNWHVPFLADVSAPFRLHGLGIHLHLDPPRVYDATDPNCRLIVSAGRCARISYRTTVKEKTPEEDFALGMRLMKSGHWSPFEHIAVADEVLFESHESRGLGTNFAAPFIQLRALLSQTYPSSMNKS